MRADSQSRTAAIICLIAALICLAISQCAEARDFKLIEAREIALSYRQYTPGGSYPLITDNGLGHSLDKGLDVTLNFDLLRFFYWENRIVSMTDQDQSGHGQFRLVGWNYRLGLQITEHVQLGFYHFSQHLLDASFPWHFPVEDAVELKITILRAPEPRKGLF